MIGMILKYLWAQRKSNFLLFIELMFAGIFLFYILDISIAMYRAYRIPDGFDTERCYVINIELDRADSTKNLDIKEQFDRYLKSRPEVEAIATTYQSEPYSGSSCTIPLVVNDIELQVSLMEGDGNFANVLSIPIAKGRWFTDGEMMQKSKVCVVNEHLFKALKISNAIGTQIDLGLSLGGKHKVIGIIPDVKTGSFQTIEPTVFTPLNPRWMYHWRTIVKLREGKEEMFAATLKYITVDMPSTLGIQVASVADFERKKAAVDSNNSNMFEGMMWGFAFFLVNVFLGIYIVFAGRIKKRFQEIGIRIAVGASRKAITRMVIGESLMLLFLSAIPVLLIIINLVYYEKLNTTFEVTSLRVIGEFILTELILAVAVVASVLIPALRASKVDPAVVLHYE